MERDSDSTDKKTRFFYFNSHAHVERDETLEVWDNENEISTHTLTWSVTLEYEKAVADIKISTHTLTWSVTLSV